MGAWRVGLAAGTGVALMAAAWVPQASHTTERLRGVSAVSAKVAWASGNRGTWARTIDGGATWTSAVVPGAEQLDFRDVEAFDADTAYLLAIGAGDRSRIYKTVDGGRNWTSQFVNDNPKAFYDAMAFWSPEAGIVMGDPVDGKLTLLRTTDGGATWRQLPTDRMPPALPGDGGFAASGTCIVTHGTSHVWIGTGGAATARVFSSTDRGETWMVADTPIAAGNSSSGIFSLAFRDERHGVAVGGNYSKETEVNANLARTDDGGKTWTLIGDTRLPGFRSAVMWVPGTDGRTLLAVGPSGSDVSFDQGRSWTALPGPGFHAVAIAGPQDAAWAVGENGRIAKLVGALR